MYRNGWFVLILLFILEACGGGKETSFKVVVPRGEKRTIELETVDTRQPFIFEEYDSIRVGVVKITLSRGKFARLWVGDMPYAVWVKPGKGWTATFKWNKWAFDGEDSDINGYLNTSQGRQMYFTDYYRIPNEDFRTKLEMVSSEKVTTLGQVNLNADFVEREKKRLHYIHDRHVACGVVYGSLGDWSEEKWKESTGELWGMMKEDSTSWDILEYREMMDKVLLALAKLKGRERSFHDVVSDVVGMAVESFKDQRLVEYIVNKNVLEYVKVVGVEGAEDLDRVFRKYVRDTGLLAVYDKVYETGRKLMKGEPAVPFTFKDLEGREVSLADFRGQYVYIDLWATWCGPCVAEIPHLKRLEERFRGKNICFVSISSDKDRNVWRKFVQEKALGGVQLYMGENKEYMKEIHGEGIPRFLLIDREGNFINANMTRPSDTRTWKVLEELEE